MYVFVWVNGVGGGGTCVRAFVCVFECAFVCLCVGMCVSQYHRSLGYAFGLLSFFLSFFFFFSSSSSSASRFSPILNTPGMALDLSFPGQNELPS